MKKEVKPKTKTKTTTKVSKTKVVKEEEKVKTNSKKKVSLKNKKIAEIKKYILSIIIAIVVLILVITGSIFLNKKAYLEKYKADSERITNLKLNTYYSTENSNEYKYVTYEEAIGLMVFANRSEERRVGKEGRL